MRSLSLLAKKELRALLAAPAFWLFLLCVTFLTGYSFIEAARLFAEASRSAQSHELARGLSPLDGIFVPTLGGLYLASTLLYPFLAIRFISSEKESGSLKLSLQFPPSLERIVAAKVIALAIGWTLGLAMPVSAFLLWAIKGGHVSGFELANLTIGHALYAFAITGVAILAASIADSTAAAGLLALAVVLGNWVLDFAASTQIGWVRTAATLSLTSCLHAFEKGLFSSPQVFVMVIIGLIGLASGAVWLRVGEARPRRSGKMASIFAAGILIAALSSRFPFYRDASEDKRNSFKLADARSLAQLEKPLNIKVYLNPDDSRLWDLDRTVLSKLKRTVRDVRINLESAGSSISTSGSDRYGLIVIEYNGKTAQTRSTSEEEALPIIYGLAGQKAPNGPDWDYPGYPLAADFTGAAVWFYVIIPGMLAAGWWHVKRQAS